MAISNEKEQNKYQSTRGGEKGLSSLEAVLKGISTDGGLFVPYYIEKEKYNDLKKLFLNNATDKVEATYEQVAFEIMKTFFTDLEEEELKVCIGRAYTDKFEVKVKNNFLELYHGPTCAFKDGALLFLPQLMTEARRKLNFQNEIVILTATSGDTGKAALEGFKDIAGLKVIVFYPKNGVSKIQEMQMRTQRGNNVDVVSIDGNFDDAQKGVKEIFNDKKFNEFIEKSGYSLSSANSINVGRLIPQIVYYFYGYFQMVNKGDISLDEKINIVVPTGNFGNILAAYYGKIMGLPINKLICASNENNVLTDFFETGVYDKRRELILTQSPSMDILVSSNLERLIYEVSGRNSEIVNNLMNDLQERSIYSIPTELKSKFTDFWGGYATEEEVYASIKKVYEEKNYVIDTHTAVAQVVYEKYKHNTGDTTVPLIASTASPFKFPESICKALGILQGEKDFALLDLLSEKCDLDIPDSLEELDKLPVLHSTECRKDEMRDTIKKLLNL